MERIKELPHKLRLRSYNKKTKEYEYIFILKIPINKSIECSFLVLMILTVQYIESMFGKNKIKIKRDSIFVRSDEMGGTLELFTCFSVLFTSKKKVNSFDKEVI